MKIRPQMTRVEERISSPAWRSASPKKRKTLRPKTSPTTRPQNLTMSPNDAIQSRGMASQPRHFRLRISGWVASSVCVNT